MRRKVTWLFIWINIAFWTGCAAVPDGPAASAPQAPPQDAVHDSASSLEQWGGWSGAYAMSREAAPDVAAPVETQDQETATSEQPLIREWAAQAQERAEQAQDAQDPADQGKQAATMRLTLVISLTENGGIRIGGRPYSVKEFRKLLARLREAGGARRLVLRPSPETSQRAVRVFLDIAFAAGAQSIYLSPEPAAPLAVAGAVPAPPPAVERLPQRIAPVPGAPRIVMPEKNLPAIATPRPAVAPEAASFVYIAPVDGEVVHGPIYLHQRWILGPDHDAPLPPVPPDVGWLWIGMQRATAIPEHGRSWAEVGNHFLSPLDFAVGMVTLPWRLIQRPPWMFAHSPSYESESR